MHAQACRHTLEDEVKQDACVDAEHKARISTKFVSLLTSRQWIKTTVSEMVCVIGWWSGNDIAMPCNL